MFVPYAISGDLPVHLTSSPNNTEHTAPAVPKLMSANATVSTPNWQLT